jgi:hypothetical protein
MYPGEEIVSAMVVDEDELEAEYQRKIMGNVVAAEAVSEEELKSSARRKFLCRCLVPLILVAIVLGVVIPLTGPDNSGPYPSASPTLAPTLMNDYDYLQSLLLPISGDTLLDETTIQYRALDWLAYEDPANFVIRDTNTSELISRYIMAVVYYGTGGPEWRDDAKFLTNHSVCDWNSGRQGVYCENGLVKNLRLGM